MTAIIVMAKRPEIGKCKTRLAKNIGEELAFDVYNLLLSNTLCKVEELGYPVFLFLTGVGEMEIPESFEIRNQSDGNLGNRMRAAFQCVFDEGFQNIVMLGTDCYELNNNHIAKAKEYLEKDTDIVIGPSEDGGYYLVGMRGMYEIFDGIDWSTPEVFKQSVAKIEEQHLSWTTLEELNDIDTLEDLRRSTLRPNLPRLIRDI